MMYVPAANAAGMTELRVISRDLPRRVGLEQVIRDGHSAKADCRLAGAKRATRKRVTLSAPSAVAAQFRHSKEKGITICQKN